MTISTTTIKDSYAGNGSTSAFTYNFKIADDDDIQVIIRAANGTETVKTKTTHYTVSGVGNNSGTVTFTAGNIPISTQTVILRRSTPQTQELDLIENDPLPANSIETAYDKLTQISQELQEQIDRSIKLSRTNTITSTEFTVGSADRANKILAFDANGEIAVTQELGTYRGNWATATAYNGRDLVKDTSNNNIYIVNTAHTSSGAQPLSSNANTAYYTLIVDAATATSSATAAAASASAAASSASAASTSATNAASSASTASTQATNAANSATTSSTQAGLATTAATNAATSESNAAASASTATSQATSATNSASTATTQATNASNSATSASGSATTATTQASAASASASAASTSATNAAASASTATSQATNAASSASAASTSASNAATSASNASTSATAAQAAQSAAEAVFDTFDDKYLGAKSVEPTLDNDSNALTDGALYYNTVSNRLKVYDLATTAWLFVAPSSADQSNINTVATNIASVQDVSANIGSVNDFAARYRVSATAPTTSLDLGDLYFDTTANTMKVYSSGGFINAGSSVNGTADRYKYTATASQTTFTGTDDNTNTLAYDAGFLDVYLNGIKLVNGSDFTATSGTSIVLATGASASDILEVIAYGTFQLANFSITDANDVPNSLGTAGQVLKVNSGATALEFGTIDLNNLNATNLTSGTLPDARFPATLPATSGANLTSLNASNLSSGTVSTARLGTGTANATNFLRGDNSWQTISTSPEQLVKSMPLASGGSLTAGRGVFINSSGEVALYPTLNTVGTEYSNSNATAYTTFSNNGSRALKYTIAGLTYTFTGVVLSGTASAVNGGTTVTATVPSGVDDQVPYIYIYPISNTEFYVVAGRTTSPYGFGPYNYDSKHFVVTVDGSGNCTKGTEVNLAGTGGTGSGGTNGFYVGKITDSVFAFWGYTNYGNQYRTVTISGTTVTLTSDNEAVSFAPNATGFNTVYTTNNIIGCGAGNNWLTASYTAGNIGTVTTTATITDAQTTPAWFKITDARIMVYYQDTSLLYKLRTYDVNQTTGALTLVDTEFLTGTVWASSAGNFRFKDQNTGVFKYLSGGFYYINSIALDSSGNFTGFNLGSKIDTGDITPVYNSSNDFFINYTQATPRLRTYTVNANTTTTPNYLGVAKETDSTTPVNIITDGVAGGLSGLTSGSLYYISTNYDGTVSTDSTSGILVGKAISATEILLQRSNTQ